MLFGLQKTDWKILFYIFLTVFIIYAYSLIGNFVFDDRNIVDNIELLSRKENVGEILMHPFWEIESGLYRPVTVLSYSLNIATLGADPIGFHLVNIFLYAFLCSLIYILIKRLFKNETLALIATFLFIVLPIHTEVVANISGRGELLALLFSLLALLEFIKEKSNFWLAGLWTFLAIGSKEVAIAVLPLVFVVLYIKEKKIDSDTFKNNFRSIASSIIALVFYFFLRFFSLGTSHFLGVKTSLVENPLIFTDVWSRIATSFKILWMYVEKTFWPLNLCSDYSYNQIPILHNFLNLEVILGIVILIAGIIFIFVYRDKNKVFLLGASIFIFSFLPVSNILFPTGTIAGERLFFFPSLGFCLITAFVLYKFFIKLEKKNIRIIMIVLGIILLIIYGFISIKRQNAWISEENLFLSAASCAPRSVLSRSNSGAIYLLRGDLKKAQEELELARNIKPIYSKGLNNLGLVYWKNGENEKAEKMYKEAMMQDFPYSGAYENLVLLYLDEGKMDQARHWLNFLYPNNQNLSEELINNYINTKK